jgi:hypothetical protein
MCLCIYVSMHLCVYASIGCGSVKGLQIDLDPLALDVSTGYHAAFGIYHLSI